MLKKASLLTRPTLARRDAPCPKQGRSERRGEEVQTTLRVGRSPLQWVLVNGKVPTAFRTSEKFLLNVEALSDARTPLADFFSILLNSPYQRTNPVAHVTPPPKLPSRTMSWGRILPERTAWSSAIGNDADDVLP